MTMKVSDLKDNMIVLARTGRAGRTCVEWEEPMGQFVPHTLYVSRDKNNELSIITLRDKVWAECGMSDLNFISPEGGEFVCEDWYLQIKGLEK